MDSLGEIVLIASIYGSIVGIIILLTKGLLKKIINAKWGYIIWCVLLIKLIIPFGPQSNLSIFNNSSFNSVYINNQEGFIANIGKEEINNSSTITEKEDIVNNINVADDNLEESKLTEGSTPDLFNINFNRLVSLIWLLGTLIMLLVFGQSHYLLNKKISRESSNKDFDLELDSCKERMNISKNNISIVVTNIINTPSIIGIIKPKILIPKNMLSLSEKEIEYVLLHELAHYKRKDIIINYLLIILQSIHWFNPILWYCFKMIREEMELATDELVLNKLKEDEHKGYGKAILAVLEKIQSTKERKVLVGIINDKNGVKKRIENIKFMKNKKASATIFGLLIVLILSIVLLTSRINISKLEQSYLINFYTNFVNKDIKGKSISSDELNEILDKEDVDNFTKSSGIVSNIDDDGKQTDYSTDNYVYNIGEETLEVAFLIDEKNNKALEKVNSVIWNLENKDTKDTKLHVYYYNGNYNIKALNVGVYPKNLSEQKSLFNGIEKGNEIYDSYFNISKLIEDDITINSDEIANLNNLNFKEIENQYELDSNIRIYLYEDKGNSIYLNYNEEDKKIVRLSIESKDSNKFGLMYSKDLNSGIQMWREFDNLNEQIQVVDKLLKALDYNK